MEAARPLLSPQPKLSPLPPNLSIKLPLEFIFTRRRLALVSLSSCLLQASSQKEPACAGLDLRMTQPGQTVEEAMTGIRGHARSLLGVKPLLESGFWEEAQKEMRRSSAFLKQDIYTIIQSRPGGERPRLRKLYSDLFNGVSRMDYAARDRDGPRVWQCYEKITVALDEILRLI